MERKDCYKTLNMEDNNEITENIIKIINEVFNKTAPLRKEKINNKDQV